MISQGRQQGDVPKYSNYLPAELAGVCDSSLKSEEVLFTAKTVGTQEEQQVSRLSFMNTKFTSYQDVREDHPIIDQLTLTEIHGTKPGYGTSAQDHFSV